MLHFVKMAKKDDSVLIHLKMHICVALFLCSSASVNVIYSVYNSNSYMDLKYSMIKELYCMKPMSCIKGPLVFVSTQEKGQNCSLKAGACLIKINLH